VLLINKMDLVSTEEAEAVVARVRELNPMAKLIECTKSRVDLDAILDIGAYDLERAMTIDPVAFGLKSEGVGGAAVEGLEHVSSDQEGEAAVIMPRPGGNRRGSGGGRGRPAVGDGDEVVTELEEHDYYHIWTYNPRFYSLL